MTNNTIHHRVATGRWEKVLPGVYILAGTPASPHQEVMAACLWAGAGAVASHETAGEIWELEGLSFAAVEISVERPRRTNRFTIHHVGVFGMADRTVHKGLPVTSPATTIVDLASKLDVSSLERALDCALRERLVTLTRMKWQLKQSPGKRGVKTLERLLAQRQKYGVPQTELERDFLRLIKSSPLDMPYSQYLIPGIGHVDFCWPEDKLIIETDGYAFHSDPDAFEQDRARDQEAVRLGLRVVRLTKRDIKGRPEHVIKLITSLKDEVRRQDES